MKIDKNMLNCLAKTGKHPLGPVCAMEERMESMMRERDAASANLERFKKNWFSARSELEVSERENRELRADLKRAKAEVDLLAEVTSLREFVDSVAELIGHDGPRETEAMLDRIHVHHKDYMRGWGTLEQLRRAQAEAAAMREALEKFNQWWFAQNYEADGPILISAEEVGVLAFVTRRAVSPGAGAALLAEVTRLREVERLAKGLKAETLALNQYRERMAGIPTDQIKGWHDEYERLLNNIRTAEAKLFEALGEAETHG